MKHETLMLHGLFAACLLVCTLVLGSMLTASPASLQPAASHALAASTSPCVAPDGVQCPLPRG
jgi:hypothetical protein